MRRVEGCSRGGAFLYVEEVGCGGGVMGWEVGVGVGMAWLIASFVFGYPCFGASVVVWHSMALRRSSFYPSYSTLT